MNIQDLHCVVIGAGIGGLAAGALLARQGAQVVVLESQSCPGGCAATISLRGRQFDVGATIGCGFQPDGPMAQLGRDLDISWPIQPSSVAWNYRHRDMKLDLAASRAALLRRFPRSASFWEEQAALAAILWRLSSGGLSWPPVDLADLGRLSRKALTGLPDAARLLPLASKSAYDWMADHGLTEDPAFVRFIDAQLLISTQTISRYANALTAAIALDLPVSGAWVVDGGMGRIAGLLASSIERDGGAILYKKRVERLDSVRREVLGIETQDGGVFAADLVIANLTPESLACLDGMPPDPPIPDHPARMSAFMLYAVMDKALFDHVGCDHLQLIADAGDPGEGRSIFVSAFPASAVSPDHDEGRSVTISTHTLPEPWFEALRRGREHYVAMKQQYTSRVLELLYALLPEAAGSVRSVTAATPVTWERWTGRHAGRVGGYPQTSLFGVRGPGTHYDNLFLVGDSVFPGQSLPGVVTSARRCVELVAKRYGKKGHGYPR